jgi:hypothetical protein
MVFLMDHRYCHATSWCLSKLWALYARLAKGLDGGNGQHQDDDISGPFDDFEIELHWIFVRELDHHRPGVYACFLTGH